MGNIEFNDTDELLYKEVGFDWKKFFITILCVLGFIFLVIMYARFNATRGINVIEYKVTDSSLPDNFHGVKLVQFSDLYFGNTVDVSYLNLIVSKINELKPDIVVFTGDLSNKEIDDDTRVKIIEAFNSIDAKLGKYAISGDIDNVNFFNTVIESSGFINLNNSSSNIFYNSDVPVLISNQDVETNLYSILLLHQPDSVDNLTNHFNLILSGHSLNGQINIPFVKNILLPNGAKKYYNGHYSVNSGSLYVSNGIGTTNFKYRFFNRPSISLYRLTCH